MDKQRARDLLSSLKRDQDRAILYGCTATDTNTQALWGEIYLACMMMIRKLEKEIEGYGTDTRILRGKGQALPTDSNQADTRGKQFRRYSQPSKDGYCYGEGESDE